MPAVTETPLQRLERVLRAELAFYPGRVSLVARIVVTCTIVMLFIMVFRIPGGALGAYYPLLLSRDSPRSTLKSAALAAGICILGTGEILLGAMLFAGSPPMHFLWIAANLYLVFFLISSMEIYDTALAFGLLLTSAITVWDLDISAEARVERTLFTLLAILIGCMTSVVIEFLFAQTHPPDRIVASFRERLSLVGNLMQLYAEGKGPTPSQRSLLVRYSTKGVGDLRDYLTHSAYDADDKDRLRSALALCGRVVELAANLAESDLTFSEDDRLRCQSIAANIAAIDASLSHAESPEWIELPALTAYSTVPSLVELERNVDLITQSLANDEQIVHHLPEPDGKRFPRIFKRDAWTSNRHLRFATRGGLSALACYIAYSCVGWTGLNASIATCILTALTNTGASRHKQLLRLSGILIGACVLGFGSQILILPQIDSLPSFAVLFACVIGIGAWVGTSGPRIAYCGIQIVLAYDLVNLTRFGISTSLVPARDAVLGIALGVAAMWLIFDHLWVESSVGTMRSMFVVSMRDIAALHLDDQTTASDQNRRISMEGQRIHRVFDQLRSLSDSAVFETHPISDEEAYIVTRIPKLQPKLRALLLVKTGLLHHQSIDAANDTSTLVADVQKLASDTILECACLIEDPIRQVADQPESASRDLLIELSQKRIRNTTSDRTAITTEMHLCWSLLMLASDLRESITAGRQYPVGDSI